MARETTAVVADYDTIRVKHRYNFEYKTITQSLGHLVITDEEVQETFHYK